jgi:hypothetical protein
MLTDTKWIQARQVLETLKDDASKLGVESFSLEDHNQRRQIPSPISGLVIELETKLLLNGMWVVSIEAEQKYLFGLLYRSIFTNVLIGPNGVEGDNQFGSRIEFCSRRRIRRNWGRGTHR